MEKTQKFIVSENGIEESFYVSGNISKDRDKLFCPVCNLVMKNSEDFDSFALRKCCSACDLEFAQKSYKKWDSGWRPSKSQIDNHIKNVEKRTINLFDIEEDT